MRISPIPKIVFVVIPILCVLLALISPVYLSSILSRNEHRLISTINEQKNPNNNRNDQQLIQSPQELPIGYIKAESIRPIHNYQITDILLVSDIEGGLHALRRATGEILWSIDNERPLVEVATNHSDPAFQPENSDDSITWIVEPYGSGSLYFFTRELGLTKFPFSISHLVLKSPFAFSNRVFTGIRRTSLYSVDLNTGEILSSFGSSSCNTNSDGHVLQNTILLGKTTYELTIHSKGSTSWNVTYSTWGPNNVDFDLIEQNKDPLDGTVFSPLPDRSLLAIDYNSKFVKWMSRLPTTVINVFDVINDYNNDGLQSVNEYVCLPHPLRRPNEEKNEATFIDMTDDGSWYALGSDSYPLLVKSAPASKYSLSDRWRGPHFINTPEELQDAMVGVHFIVENEGNADQTLGLIGYPYPTNFPAESPYIKVNSDVQIRGTNEIQPFNPTSVTTVPTSSSPVIDFGHMSREGNGFSDTVYGKFLFRCFENAIMALMFLLMVIAMMKFNLIPSLNVLLQRNGLELREFADNIEIANEFKPLDVKALDEEQKSTSDDIGPRVNENDTAIEETTEDSIDEPATESNNGIDAKVTAQSKSLEEETPIEKLKKEVKIIEPPIEDRVSADPNSPGLKKRKRGSRGGKKNKKSPLDIEVKDQSVKEVETPNDQQTQSTERLTGLTLSDTVLGYGSYGTVVLKGSFQNRDVAVKRMLIDFYDVASHEINLLTESDDHPNVIRYFYSETNDKFLYIALELCSASLEDVIEKSFNHKDLVRLMNPVNVLEQVAKGLHHLHSLKIVHRDIKPQNILVAPPKKLKTKEETFSPVRILISDFGLCKRLEADESSFKATTQHAAGTSGWRAPELLLENSYSLSLNSEHSFNTSSNSIADPVVFDAFSKRKLTRAIDIFSLGCVFFYILTNGGHPFGDRYLREGNVIKNEYSLDSLDILPNNVEEAKDLISIMIARDPKSRPSTAQVLIHPFFWPNSKKLEFLLKVSDRFEVEQRDPPSDLLQALESVATTVIGNDWCSKFDKVFIDNLGKYRKYHTDRLMDLLRALRNKYHHFNDLPPELVTKMSPLPSGFYEYFNKRFPKLLMEIYYVVEQNLKDDHILSAFF